MLRGNVLITGGSGFLGRAILRRIDREGWPANVTIYSRDEGKQAAVARRYPSVRCVLGDIRDQDRLAAVATGHDLIIHGGAVKRIPEAEHNVFECVEINVDGSRSVAMAAIRAGVPVVIGLSTDKACEPLNTYGMTKALMERIFGEANRYSAGEHPTRFGLVRYGNVVSASGSVVPLFRDQARAGEVRVTDSRMTRFWLKNDDAIDLIIAATYHARSDPGSTVIGWCGAMEIMNLARMVAGAARIVETGLRPGEKLHESLLARAETPRLTALNVPHGIVPSSAKSNMGAVVLLPATTTDLGVESPAYCSDNPAFWIQPDDMAAMIADAEELEYG